LKIKLVLEDYRDFDDSYIILGALLQYFLLGEAIAIS